VPAKKTKLSGEQQPRQYYLGLIFMLAAPAAMARYYYGSRALLLLGACIAGAVLSDLIGSSIVKTRTKSPYDFSAVFTDAAIALMLPASFPFALAAIGGAFAVIVAKLPFGDAQNAPFVPAAAGFAFLSVCWPAEVFNYPGLSSSFEWLSFTTAPGIEGTSLASMLQVGNAVIINPISFFNLITGNYPGPMGTGVIVVLLACGVYYLFTKPSALLNSLGFIASTAAIAILFPRVGTGLLSSLILELCSGTLIFAALFLITDNASSPKKWLHRFAYGFLTGMLCMALRHFGVFEEGVCFAILLANAAWPFAESGLSKLEKTAQKNRQRNASARAALQTGGDTDA